MASAPVGASVTAAFSISAILPADPRWSKQKAKTTAISDLHFVSLSSIFHSFLRRLGWRSSDLVRKEPRLIWQAACGEPALVRDAAALLLPGQERFIPAGQVTTLFLSSRGVWGGHPPVSPAGNLEGPGLPHVRVARLAVGVHSRVIVGAFHQDVGRIFVSGYRGSGCRKNKAGEYVSRSRRRTFKCVIYLATYRATAPMSPQPRGLEGRTRRIEVTASL